MLSAAVSRMLLVGKARSHECAPLTNYRRNENFMRKGPIVMRTRIIFAILAAVAIAGCSGGGGSSLPSPHNGGSTQQSIKEQAQTATEAAFDPIETADLEAGLYNGQMGVALSTSRAPLSGFSNSNGACNHGVEHFVTVISPTQTQYETKYFYDNACTQLARDVVALVTMNSSSSESIVRTATNYNRSGLVLSTRKSNYALTGSVGDFSAVLTSGLFIGTSTNPAAQFGRQFTIAPQSGNVSTIAANSGHIVNVDIPSINESFGHMGVLQNGTMTTDSSNNVTFAGTHSGTFSKGPLGSLTLSSAPPFTVSGGTMLGTTTVQGSVEFNSTCDIVSVNITGTLWNGDNIVVTSTGTAPGVAINGTITTASGGAVATFSVDEYGDGIITYADGNQALIIDWHVVR